MIPIIFEIGYVSDIKLTELCIKGKVRAQDKANPNVVEPFIMQCFMTVVSISSQVKPQMT